MSFWKKWTGTSLVLRITIGVVTGAALGLLVPSWKGIAILGDVFVGALKAIAPVLVAVLVAASIARAGSGLGRRFLTVIILYLCTTLLAALVAVGGSFLFPVGLQLSDAAAGGAPGTLSEVFANLLKNMVANPVQAMATGNYIGILFWSVVVGLALKAVASQPTISTISDFASVMSKTVGYVIQFAPLGILGLVFRSVSEGGLAIFTTYGKLLALLVGCMLFVYFVVNPLVHFLLLGRNPWPLLLQCLRDSGVNAFFTRSSAANIPVNMDLCGRLGLVAGGSLLLVPMACSLFGISQDIAMQAVGVGFIIGVVQDSMETAVNSSADVFFTATAEMLDRRRRGF